MSLDRLILGFLDEEPQSGYDLKVRCFDAAAPAFWSADQAQIYRTLERLERDGLVSSRSRRTPGRPDRHVFSLTESGRAALGSWMVDDDPLSPVREPALAKLALATHATDDELIGSLGSYRARLEKRLDGLEAQHEDLSSERATRKAALRVLVLEQAIERDRSALAWADRFERAVNSGDIPGAARSRSRGGRKR